MPRICDLQTSNFIFGSLSSKGCSATAAVRSPNPWRAPNHPDSRRRQSPVTGMICRLSCHRSNSFAPNQLSFGRGSMKELRLVRHLEIRRRSKDANAFSGPGGKKSLTDFGRPPTARFCIPANLLLPAPPVINLLLFPVMSANKNIFSYFFTY